MSLITTGYKTDSTEYVYATGGTITTVNGYAIHTFTGTTNFIIPTKYDLTDVSYLIVAGGAGGGLKGGGGAGGYIYVTGQTITKNQSLGVFVGNGGLKSTNGDNSVFNGSTAIGGGKGADYNYSDGSSGGSGGGASGYVPPNYSYPGGGTTGQGTSGGNGCSSNPSPGSGGGGGAGQSGGTGTNYYGGNGGSGITNSITGSAVVYAGGGGGHGISNGPTRGIGGTGGGGNGGGTTGTDGTNGLGGGGGAGTTTPGKGGSGVVIIKYSLSQPIVYETCRNVFRIGDRFLEIDFNSYVNISSVTWGTVNYAENFDINVTVENHSFQNGYKVVVYCPTDVNYAVTGSTQTISKGGNYTWVLNDKFGGDSTTGYRIVIVQVYTGGNILLKEQSYSVYMNGTPTLGTMQTAAPTVYGDYGLVGSNYATVTVTGNWTNVGGSTALNCRLSASAGVYTSGYKQHVSQYTSGTPGSQTNCTAGSTISRSNTYDIWAWRDSGGATPVNFTVSPHLEYQKVSGGSWYNGGDITLTASMNVS